MIILIINCLKLRAIQSWREHQPPPPPPGGIGLILFCRFCSCCNSHFALIVAVVLATAIFIGIVIVRVNVFIVVVIVVVVVVVVVVVIVVTHFFSAISVENSYPCRHCLSKFDGGI